MSIKPIVGEGRIRDRGGVIEPLKTGTWLDGAVLFDHRRWQSQDTELYWTAPFHLIVVTHGGSTARTHVRSEGRLVYDGRDRPGDVTFVPAGADRLGQYKDVALSYSALWIDPQLDHSGCGRLGNLPIHVNGRDPVIATLMDTLRQELLAGTRPDTLYVEHMLSLSALRLAQLDRKPSPAPKHAALSQPILSRIIDYIDANIAADIRLEMLASLAGMPADTFSRRFKAATGKPPYVFVIEHRIRRAETMLTQSHAALSDIALALGFSSQSHFTSTFRRLRGVTPRAYRANFFPHS